MVLELFVLAGAVLAYVSLYGAVWASDGFVGAWWGSGRVKRFCARRGAANAF